MTNVSVLPGVARTDLDADAQPQAEIIEFLRELLADAERGDIQAIAVCYVRAGGITGEGSCVPRGGISAQLLSAAMADMLFEHFSQRRHASMALDPAS